MEQSTVNPSTVENRDYPWGKRGLLILILLALVAAGLLMIRSLPGGSAGPIQPEGKFITAEELESRHGLRVRLIGVTAGGGMVDFRMKITDPDKAQPFLEDPANLPQLIVAESGEALMVPEGLDEDIEWQTGGILFNFYPNDRRVVEPGTPVIVQFGTVQLEPVAAQ